MAGERHGNGMLCVNRPLGCRRTSAVDAKLRCIRDWSGCYCQTSPVVRWHILEAAKSCQYLSAVQLTETAAKYFRSTGQGHWLRPLLELGWRARRKEVVEVWRSWNGRGEGGRDRSGIGGVWRIGGEEDVKSEVIVLKKLHSGRRGEQMCDEMS